MAIVAAKSRLFVNALLLLCIDVVSTSNCGIYRGDIATDLKINHAQVLGSHNSYHVGNPVVPAWNYDHPPLDVQLDLGLRAFELDVYYDFAREDIRVLHVVHADEGSTCKTLLECLSLAKTWSNANPWHFPFFFQLEFLGGIKKVGESPCLFSDIEPAADCIMAKCTGAPVSGVNTCVLFNCLSDVLAASAKNSACNSLLTCFNSETGKVPSDTLLTADIGFGAARACTATVDTSIQKVALSNEELPVVAEKITRILDATFPSSHRVAPKDIFTGTLSESPALAGYTHQGTFRAGSPGGNFWPTVDASRGKALFWLTHAAAMHPQLPFATRPLFLDGVDMSVRKADDPAGAAALVQAGALVRTRSDVPVEVLSSTRRSTALGSGAGVISTDLFPTADAAPAGHADWTGLDASTHVWIPDGMPVRCNPVTAVGITDCKSLLLEDPSALRCGTTATTTTTTKTTTTKTTATTTSPTTSVTTVMTKTVAPTSARFIGLLTVAATGLDQFMLVTAAENAVAAHFGVDVATVKVMVTKTRRLSAAPRNLADTWSVSYEFTASAANVAAVEAKVNELATTTGKAAMKSVVGAKLIAAGAPQSAVDSIIVTATPPGKAQPSSNPTDAGTGTANKVVGMSSSTSPTATTMTTTMTAQTAVANTDSGKRISEFSVAVASMSSRPATVGLAAMTFVVMFHGRFLRWQ